MSWVQSYRLGSRNQCLIKSRKLAFVEFNFKILKFSGEKFLRTIKQDYVLVTVPTMTSDTIIEVGLIIKENPPIFF